MPAANGWGPITSLVPTQQYPPGIKLFKQESPPRDVYLIEDGLVKLTYVEQINQRSGTFRIWSLDQFQRKGYAAAIVAGL